jgi:hypothetical protein
MALSRLDAEAALDTFTKNGIAWDIEGAKALVFEDRKDGVGLTMQIHRTGVVIGVDVWNDALVENISAGMTKEEVTQTLGAPVAVTLETLGDARLVSVSQSNRYHNRITNISADSQVTVLRYGTEDGGNIQAVFIKGIEECLMIEVRPR